MTNKLLLAAFACFVLSGCISGRAPDDTYTDSHGQTTLIQSDREMCTQSCNDDYSRCMDTDDAEDNSAIHGPTGMFGSSAECRSALKACLPRCKSE